MFGRERIRAISGSMIRASIPITGMFAALFFTACGPSRPPLVIVGADVGPLPDMGVVELPDAGTPVYEENMSGGDFAVTTAGMGLNYTISGSGALIRQT